MDNLEVAGAVYVIQLFVYTEYHSNSTVVSSWRTSKMLRDDDNDDDDDNNKVTPEGFRVSDRRQ